MGPSITRGVRTRGLVSKRWRRGPASWLTVHPDGISRTSRRKRCEWCSSVSGCRSACCCYECFRLDGASHLERTALQVLVGITPDVILAATAREPEEGPSQTNQPAACCVAAPCAGSDGWLGAGVLIQPLQQVKTTRGQGARRGCQARVAQRYCRYCR